MLMQSLAPYIAFGNVEWGAYGHGPGFTPEGAQWWYDSLAGKWTVSQYRTTTPFAATLSQTKRDVTASGAFSSDSTSLATRPTAGSKVPAPKSNGSIFVTIMDDYYYQTTNLSVSTFDGGTQANATWADSKGLIWDYDNSLWLAAVNDTTGDGEVWSAASDFTGGWTLRSTPDTTYGMTDIAQAGAIVSNQIIATTDGPRCYTSSDGTTWTQRTSNQITLGAECITWCEGASLFFAVEQSSGDIWTTSNGISWKDNTVAYGIPPASHIISSDEMVIIISTAATDRQVWACHGTQFTGPGVIAMDPGWIHLGNLGEDDFAPAYGDSVTDGNKSEAGSAGELVYMYLDALGVEPFCSWRYKPINLEGTIT